MQAPADVYLDGVRLRSIRDRGCQKVPAGTHTFVLRGPMVVEKHVTVTLAPGEVRQPVLVDLQRLPAHITIPGAYADSCVAILDGKPLGTLTSAGRDLTVAHPESPHEVALQCGRTRYKRVYTSLDYPSVVFDGEVSP